MAACKLRPRSGTDGLESAADWALDRVSDFEPSLGYNMSFHLAAGQVFNVIAWAWHWLGGVFSGVGSI